MAPAAVRFDRPRVGRRAAVVLVIGVLLLVGAAAWRWRAQPSGAIVAAAPAEIPWPPAVPPAAPAAPDAPTAAPAPIAASLPASVPAVASTGRRPLPASPAEALPPDPCLVRPDADLLARLSAQGDEPLRAAAWRLAAAGGDAGARERLATLAAGSGDPLVAAQAARSCAAERGPGSACLLLPPGHWAALEPDNAAAWLDLAADARADPAVQAEALQRAADAGRLDPHADALHPLLQQALPDDTPDTQRAALGRAVESARGEWLGTEALRFHCGAAVLNDADRAGSCERLASLLLAQGTTLADRQEAQDLGRRLGWPASRLDTLRDETEALRAVQRERTAPAGEAACATPSTLLRWQAEVGRLGELGALRAAAPPR